LYKLYKRKATRKPSGIWGKARLRTSRSWIHLNTLQPVRLEFRTWTFWINSITPTETLHGVYLMFSERSLFREYDKNGRKTTTYMKSSEMFNAEISAA